MQRFADYIGIGAEAAAPQAITDEHGDRAAESLFLRAEIASQYGRDSQDLEEARRDPGVPESFGELTGSFGGVLKVIAADRREAATQTVPILQAHGCDEGLADAC